MKNNILKICFILMTLLFINSNAQNYPKDGDNILDNNINKFVGTWVWSSGTENLKLIFKKENIKLIPTSNIRADVLYGFHQYTQNGTIIENSTQYSTTSYEDKKSTLLGGSHENAQRITGGITHLSKNKSIRFEIEYIDASHIKLVKLENYEGIRIQSPGQPPFDWSISLPQNIVLTKQ